MLQAFLKRQLNRFGFDLVRTTKKRKWPSDFEPELVELITQVQPYTMTSPERIFGLSEAVKYVVRNNISGDFVECGVWKGGSMLAMARLLEKLGDESRHLYLYDTFEGMSDPSVEDVSFDNHRAESMLSKNENKEENLVWAFSTLDNVKQTMSISNYPRQKIHYIKGKVEDTIPQNVPRQIALLRLDTDWYESTKHELTHLFPLLVPSGVLIIDDYGYWKGARKAVDEYFLEKGIKILLARMDDTGRIAVKF